VTQPFAISLEELLEFIKSRQIVNVYEIAKKFGVSYGTAQWYVFSLQRRGLVREFKIGKKRYIATSEDMLKCLKVQDVIEALKPYANMRICELDGQLASALESIVWYFANTTVRD